MKIEKARSLKGKIQMPGDKSISHRAVMLGSLAEGTTEITNFLQGADCLSTIECFQKMGVRIENTPEKITIYGKGLHGLKKPKGTLYTGNSGTTTRIISGILAGQEFVTTLNGDATIQKRPMNRIIEPLSMMGASITSINGNGCAPLFIIGQPLTGIHYQSPVASAQVKSSVLLAGLYAEGETSVTEPVLSRNHTEIMLNYFGAKVKSEGTTASVSENPVLEGQRVCVPGDISSAAYFIAAGLLVPNSEILIKNVGINETRAGILKVVKDMGGNVEILNVRRNGEPTADLFVHSSSLHGTTIEGDIIPTLIDELPVIAIMGAFAEGKTVIRDAAELKVKESDRIAIMVENLSALGCEIEALPDGMIIHGGKTLHTATVDSCYDHRIAMSFAIAALCIDGGVDIKGAEVVSISYPKFFEDLQKLQGSHSL